ncbi:hypothetical protein [Caproicibacter fermentans]|nr:hypothetical protein [Caproicibacter fermentans]
MAKTRRLRQCKTEVNRIPTIQGNRRAAAKIGLQIKAEIRRMQLPARLPEEETAPDRKMEARDLLTLTGETKTITISDESILSTQQMMGGQASRSASSGDTVSQQTESGGASAALSDIQDGTVLKVTYQSDGETLSSVVILGGKKTN